MHPILITIGSFRLPTYGVLLSVGFVGAIWTALRLGRREKFDTGRLLDFITWLILTGIVGAKVLMVVTEWPRYRDHPGELFSWTTLQAAGVFYGGFIAAAFFGVWYSHAHRLPMLKVFDVFAPAVVLGQSVGRVGCFAAGCDYGKPTKTWLGVIFTNPVSHDLTGVPLGVRLYPTQVLESLATLAIFLVLIWRYRHKTQDGQIFILYLTLYGVARFFLEFLRGDADRGFVFDHLFSTSQFIALLALGTAAALAFALRSRPAEIRKTLVAIQSSDRARS